MVEKRLNIIAADSEPSQPSKGAYSGSRTHRVEMQGTYDRLWRTDPEHLDPRRNIKERIRLERTLELIRRHTELKEKRVVDLGCGRGVFSRMLRDAGAWVDAVDVSPVALKLLEEEGCDRINPLRDYVPMTKLKDDDYDVVVCTELIAELREDEHRLLFSELSRLVKTDGWIVCSTGLDINSEDALQRFNALAESEIDIQEWVLGYNRLWLRLKDFFEGPMRFVRASRDADYRMQELKRRTRFDRWWFDFNSKGMAAKLWVPMQFLFSPVVKQLRQSPHLLVFLEKICRFFWSTNGITDALFIGKRRQLLLQLPPEDVPKETKHKKQLWE